MKIACERLKHIGTKEKKGFGERKVRPLGGREAVRGRLGRRGDQEVAECELGCQSTSCLLDGNSGRDLHTRLWRKRGQINSIVKKGRRVDHHRDFGGANVETGSTPKRSPAHTGGVRKQARKSDQSAKRRSRQKRMVRLNGANRDREGRNEAGDKTEIALRNRLERKGRGSLEAAISYTLVHNLWGMPR